MAVPNRPLPVWLIILIAVLVILAILWLIGIQIRVG